MTDKLFAYTGRVSTGSRWAPVLDQHNIREMTNRGQKPARTPFALDNGAYIDWRSDREFDVPAYENTLKNCISLRPDFIIIPDKVAGGLDSLHFSLSWIPTLRELTQGQVPLALAVQDGMTRKDVEPYLGDFEVLFLGGSRPWKYRTGEKWCRWAAKHGVPVHIGAIGSMVGVRWAKAIKATSVDSTSPLWSQRAMENWLKALEEVPPLNAPIVTPKIRPNQRPPQMLKRHKKTTREGIIGAVVGGGLEDAIRNEEAKLQVQVVNLSTFARAAFLAEAFEKVTHLFSAVLSSDPAITTLIRRLKQVANQTGGVDRVEALHVGLRTTVDDAASQTGPPWWQAALRAGVGVAQAAAVLTSKFTQANILQSVRTLAVAEGFASSDATEQRPDPNAILASLEWLLRCAGRYSTSQGSKASSTPPGSRPGWGPRPGQAAPPPPPRRVVREEPMDERAAMRALDLTGPLSEAAIKSAFRKKALAHHPDRGGSPEAFKAVRNAYEFLMKKHFGRVAGTVGGKKKRKQNRVGAASAYTAFHEQMMGDVKLAELNQIRRDFGDAHLRGKVSDEEFLELEATASAVYQLLRLEDASLPLFTDRTLQSQENLDRWIEQLSEIDEYPYFKSAYADLERAYRGKHISAFDTITLQTMCQALFKRFFAKKHAGGFGLIIDPATKVAGKAKGKAKKVSRVGAMLPITQTMVSLWRNGEDIDWGKNRPGTHGYYQVLDEAKQAASDPEAPTEFLQWLYEQHRNAQAQWKHTVVNDIAIYGAEILENPNVSAEFALRLAAYTGYGRHPKPPNILRLLENPSFSLFTLEDPDYMNKVLALIKKVHPTDLSGFMQHLQTVPTFTDWLGPEVAHYTFKAAQKSKTGFAPYNPPESVIVYRNGLVDVNYRTINEKRFKDKLFPSLSAYLQKYLGSMSEQTFVSRSDQSNPKMPHKKTSSVGKRDLSAPRHLPGQPRVSRIGAISPTTQTLLGLWKEGRIFDPYDVIPELGDKQPRELDAEFKEAASSPEVPSEFLLWLLDVYGSWIQEEVMKNPNLSLEDAFVAMDERNLPHHWKREHPKGFGYYTTLPQGVWMLDNPSFQLFLLEDPAVYERLFNAVKHIGRIASKDVYRDRVDALLAHPVMQPWLGAPTTYTFKKAKRATLEAEPDRAMFPLAITLYQNGVVRVEHTLSERRERTPLFRTLKDYLDNPSFSRPMTEKQFLAKSDQLSAKRKGK